MGSIIGHRIECNGVGALRGHTYPAKINTSNPPGCQYRSKTIMKMCLVAFVFFALTGLLFSPHKRLRVLFWDILHQCKVGCLKTVRKENNLAKSLRVVSFVACVASVSNRVIALKLERKLKKRLKGEGEGRRGKRKGEEVPSFPSPFPVIHVFLLLSQLSRRTSRGNACYAGYFIWNDRLLARLPRYCLVREIFW